MSRAWSVAFARQAMSDLAARDALEASGAARCHSLHYLQMATEKVCKAYLHHSGQSVRESHAVAKKHLVSVARDLAAETSRSSSRLKQLKRVAHEIDMLAPALRDAGSRQDNVEYPWHNLQQEVVAPVDYDFPSINDRQILSVIKMLRAAANRYLA